MTEGELAQRLGRDLGPLATDARWSLTATAGQAQGHYTDAIADAKDDLDVSTLATATTETLRQLRIVALLGCLERLELHYSLLVDTASGGQSGASVEQRLSQVQKAVGKVRALLAQRVTAVDPTRRPRATGGVLRGLSRPDYSLGQGDSVETTP